MAFRILRGGEYPRTFHDKVNAALAPAAGFRIAMAQIVDPLSVNLDISVAMADLLGKAAMC